MQRTGLILFIVSLVFTIITGIAFGMVYSNTNEQVANLANQTDTPAFFLLIFSGLSMMMTAILAVFFLARSGQNILSIISLLWAMIAAPLSWVSFGLAGSLIILGFINNANEDEIEVDTLGVMELPEGLQEGDEFPEEEGNGDGGS